MSEPTGSRPLVVYVDDERANRIVFEQSLGSELNIRVFEDAESALELLATGEVAVLVTDMRMPTMSGEELLRIAKERCPQTIRLVVTAYADVQPILRAINEGLVARYIIKPWVRAELLQVLRWATEAWRFSRDSASLHHRLLETERLATLGSVAGHLVHDLKQPLMSMVFNLDQLGELVEAAPILRAAIEHVQLDPVDHDRLAKLIDDLEPLAADLKTSASHLNRLINSLRDFVRPHRIAISKTDPLPIVRHAMSVCQELALTVGATIDYTGPQLLPHVRMSATELTQVLINVVANGAQAVAARGTPKGTITIVAREERGMLELVVRDDGIGMTADVLSRIGTPFFTTREAGTGLGVSQCQRLVGTAGGRIHIESEVGIGTTVTITLPTAA